MKCLVVLCQKAACSGHTNVTVLTSKSETLVLLFSLFLLLPHSVVTPCSTHIRMPTTWSLVPERNW